MKKKFTDYIIITIGTLLVSCALYFFLMPNDIAAGGVNGLAMVINYYLPFFDVGLLMAIMNVILFIVAFILIGPAFGFKTIYASFALSGSIWVFEKVVPNFNSITGDIMLELLIGIFMQAAGMAVIFNTNASTGGTDILAKIINKFVNIDIGKSLLMTDFIVTFLAGLTFGGKAGLYSLVAVTINGLVVDKAIEGLNAHKEVTIISSQKDLIKEFIINEIDRGATFYYGKGAYSSSEVEVLSTIVTKREFIRLKNYIKTVDHKAFIKVNDVYETVGEGFKNILE